MNNKIIKTKSQVKLMFESANLAVNCMKFISTKLVEGVTERQIANKVRSWFKRNGASKLAFPTIVAFGSDGANHHHKPTTRSLTKKDVVVIDMGCVYKGYCSDITRTFLPLKPTKKQLDVYKLVLQANKTAIKKAKVGMTSGDLDKIARQVIAKGGYYRYFNHCTGHGIGKVVHEQPKVGPLEKTILKNKMFFTIEPGIYLENEFGVRIEDTVCFANNKLVVLTKDMPK